MYDWSKFGSSSSNLSWCIMQTIQMRPSDAIWHHVTFTSLAHLIVCCLRYYQYKLSPVFNTLRPRPNGRHFPGNIFKCMKTYEFRLRFHWSLFRRVQLTMSQHWFRQWLGTGQVTSHCLNQWWLLYWRIYVSLSLNELISGVSMFSSQPDHGTCRFDVLDHNLLTNNHEQVF